MASVVGWDKASPELVVADATQPGIGTNMIMPTAKNLPHRLMCEACHFTKEPGPERVEHNTVRVQNQEVGPRPCHALTFVVALRKSISRTT